METYRKVFFWIFLILGAAYGIYNQPLLDDFFEHCNSIAKNIYDKIDLLKMDLTKSSDSIIQMLIKIVLYIFLAIILLFMYLLFTIIYFTLYALIYLLNKIYVSYAIIGIILIYPFYVIFINLFELFLLLMIRHPSRSDIRRVIGRRRIDEDTIATISEKMMAFSGEITHELESQIMTKQLKGLSRMIHAEAAFIRQMRENRIREAMRSFERR